MLYKDPVKRAAYQRNWYSQYYSLHREDEILRSRATKKRYREENRCTRCSAPLIEEEVIYCVNCQMHLWRAYPSKAERGIL